MGVTRSRGVKFEKKSGLTAVQLRVLQQPAVARLGTVEVVAMPSARKGNANLLELEYVRDEPTYLVYT